MYYQRFKSEAERFAEKYAALPNGCWQWKTGKDKEYPRFWCNDHYEKVHHYAWRQVRGHIPDGMQVLHVCDNTKCVNPEHLFLGTHLINMRDKAAKRRASRLPGVRNGRAKIDWETAAKIRRLRADKGISQQKLADRFGIGQSTISQILRGQIWRD